jgi:hypothetical protein
MRLQPLITHAFVAMGPCVRSDGHSGLLKS